MDNSVKHQLRNHVLQARHQVHAAIRLVEGAPPAPAGEPSAVEDLVLLDLRYAEKWLCDVERDLLAPRFRNEVAAAPV